jgi:hypothetical protein
VRKYELHCSYLALYMPYRLDHITPKCTTDACRAVRQITHVEFETREHAQAFIAAHGLTNVRVVKSDDRPMEGMGPSVTAPVSS